MASRLFQKKAKLRSVFDIIDVNDITLNGKEIFTTDNACAQHNDDDLNDSGYHAFSLNLQIFNLPQTASCTGTSAALF